MKAKKKTKTKGKPKAKAGKHPAGRLQFDGKNLEIVLQKLEHVWALGGSDAEAAFFADISAAALCAYLKKHPEIAERKQALLNRPVLLAREAIIGAFDGHEEDRIELDKHGKEVTVKVKTPRNPAIALNYLERKKRDEFATRTEVQHGGEVGTGNELGRQIADNPAAAAAHAKMLEALSYKKGGKDGPANPAK